MARWKAFSSMVLSSSLECFIFFENIYIRLKFLQVFILHLLVTPKDIKKFEALNENLTFLVVDLNIIKKRIFKKNALNEPPLSNYDTYLLKNYII